VPVESLGLTARRPRWSPLSSERGHLMRPLPEALRAFTDERLAATLAA
jgi:hypothetical protein